ncbi:MAG TPA: (2Fe-2S) ferredoxin domain-containing protein [Pyrinomonadaceae bacterium]|jgi:NADP-reducing hydrogenase subunit HndC
MPRLKKITHHVLVCVHKHCLKQGGRDAGKELKRTLKQQELDGRVLVTAVDCLDQCGDGPVMVVYPDGVWYGDVDERDARQIVEQHIAEGRVVERKVMRDLRAGRTARE